MAVPYSESDQGETTSVASDEVFISSSVYHEACSLYGHKCTHCRQNCEILLVPLIRAGSGVGEFTKLQEFGAIALQGADSFENFLVVCRKCHEYMMQDAPSLIAILRGLRNIVQYEHERFISNTRAPYTKIKYMTETGEKGLLYEIEFITCNDSRTDHERLSIKAGRTQLSPSLSHADVIALTRKAVAAAMSNVWLSVEAPDVCNQLRVLHLLWMWEAYSKSDNYNSVTKLDLPDTSALIRPPNIPQVAQEALEHMADLRRRVLDRAQGGYRARHKRRSMTPDQGGRVDKRRWTSQSSNYGEVLSNIASSSQSNTSDNHPDQITNRNAQSSKMIEDVYNTAQAQPVTTNIKSATESQELTFRYSSKVYAGNESSAHRLPIVQSKKAEKDSCHDKEDASAGANSRSETDHEYSTVPVSVASRLVRLTPHTLSTLARHSQGRSPADAEDGDNGEEVQQLSRSGVYWTNDRLVAWITLPEQR